MSQSAERSAILSQLRPELVQLLHSAKTNVADTFRLAQVVEKGEMGLPNPDLVQARKLYRRVADCGHGEAIYNLALMMVHGQGGQADVAEAGKLLKKAPDGDVAFRFGRHMQRIAETAETRDLETFYLQMAREAYDIAAHKGDAKAMDNLALMCSQGKGGLSNMDRAFDLWTEAAKLGCDTAMYNLAVATSKRGLEFAKAADRAFEKKQHAQAEAFRQNAQLYENDARKYIVDAYKAGCIEAEHVSLYLQRHPRETVATASKMVLAKLAAAALSAQPVVNGVACHPG